MKTNLDLAREVGLTINPAGAPRHIITQTCEAIDAFSALVEQRYRERLMGVKVEPVAQVHEGENGDRWIYSDEAYASISGPDSEDRLVHELFTAEQCAATVQQAAPKRLTRERVDAAWFTGIDGRYSIADAIQDALGIKEQP